MKKLFFLTLLIPIIFSCTQSSPPQTTQSSSTKNKKSRQNLPQLFVKKLNFQCPSAPDTIRYGNKDFGYFDTKRHSFKEGEINLDILPPFYQRAITFVGLLEGKDIPNCHHEQLFKKADETQFLNYFWAQTKGQLSDPFYLMSGLKFRSSHSDGVTLFESDLKDTERNAEFLNIIMNKWGEIVWAYYPGNGRELNDQYALARKSIHTPNEYYLLTKFKEIERINSRGQVLNHITFGGKSSNTPHHDLIQTSSPDVLISLFDQISQMPIPKDKKKFFAHPLIINKNLRYRSSLVSEINIKTKSLTHLQNKLPLNPFDLSWHRDKKVLYKKIRLILKDNYDFDFSHGNSIERKPDGTWLVSYRNRHQVLHYNKDFSQVLWKLNGDQVAQDSLKSDFHFYRQHSIRHIRDNTYMLLDNHPSPPAPEDSGTSVVVFNVHPKKKTAQLVWRASPKKNVERSTVEMSLNPLSKNLISSPIFRCATGLKTELLSIMTREKQQARFFLALLL